MEEIFYGLETQKAIANFGRGQLPRDFIEAYGEVKKAALEAIQECEKKFSPEVFSCLMAACHAIILGKMDSQFPLPLKQGGAGTSVHMNLCEVIANLAMHLYEKEHGQKIRIDPIEDVNLYQSTNDTFPTALTIMAYRHLCKIEAGVIRLQELLITKENEYGEILMLGRTEMQSALPITLGQVFGSWAGAIARDRWRMNKLKERIRTIALGGTALGTCFFAPRPYIFAAEKKLRNTTGLPLTRSQNLPDEISNQDKISELASGYRLLAQNLFKITGDLLLYTSSVVGEITHPTLQYGSSIMAAKTNPIVLEYVRGLSMAVEGEAHKIELYAQNGQWQLNAYLPFIAQSLLSIYQDLEHALTRLIEDFFLKMTLNRERIEKNLVASPVLLNCLVPTLGYNKIKELYEKLQAQNIHSWQDLKRMLLAETSLSEDKLDALFKPFHLTNASNPVSSGSR